MHYEIKYTGTEEEMDAAALKDAKEFLGAELFNGLMSDLTAQYNQGGDRTDEYKTKFIGIALGIIGIEGRPAGAMARMIEQLASEVV